MARKNVEVTKEHVASALSVETLYTKEEIQASASAFRERPEVVAGALSLVEKDELSRSQVLDAIKKFKNRKV